MPRWHHDSQFSPGPRRPLDRNERVRFSFLLKMAHLAGRLSRAERDIGQALLKRLGPDGRCDPSHATLAADAGCCERTVARACKALEKVGLLRWIRRLVRDGSRVEQTSNQYVLIPASEAERIPDRHCVSETPKKILVSVRTLVTEVAAADLGALQRIRRARELALGLRCGGAP